MTEETTIEKENYEIGFHLIPELDEGEVKKAVEELDALITSREGLITFTKEPQKFKLAYPIDHKLTSYFGFINFTAPKDSLTEMQKELKLNNKVLRYVIVKKEEKATPEVKAQPRLQKIETPASEPTEVDKQLEEIIENL